MITASARKGVAGATTPPGMPQPAGLPEEVGPGALDVVEVAQTGAFGDSADQLVEQRPCVARAAARSDRGRRAKGRSNR